MWGIDENAERRGVLTRKFEGGRLVIATHNRGKFEEMEHLLEPYGVELSSNADHGLPEPEETESTFIGNAKIKAHAAAQATGLPALADDSGIEIDGLGGAPGVHTADWAETSDGRDFVMAMTRAWEELQAVDAPEPRTARFCCTLVLAWPDGHDEVFPGQMPGRIVWPMRGDQGHGYDPIFQPDGYDVTFGEMDRWEKNRISHRADAFRKLVAGCFER
ncbi:RdgB/HAM1 family non-canonical purine NTP pyrophosphatase [Aestuariibius sp. 2305UL40-4]|uniref:RdgB/HAM1 family non-canonical purine NTP pyrophosphatase n=1 Tax=Aestuariibius violaceus TaxID=3234132 RepID=UPI00345EBA97